MKNFIFCAVFINVGYSFLIPSAIFAKDNKLSVNLGYVKVFFSIYEHLKILFCQLRKIDFSNFKMTIAKGLMEKPPFL